MGICNFCGKEVSLPHKCSYCNLTFCDEHRLPEKHDCTGLSKLGWDVSERPHAQAQNNVKKNISPTRAHVDQTDKAESPKARVSIIHVCILILGIIIGLGSVWNLRYSTGHQEGYETGYQQGSIDGFKRGNEEGHISGYDEGLLIGKTLGNQSGYIMGYDIGFDYGNEYGFIEGHYTGNVSGYNLGTEIGMAIGSELGYSIGYDEGFDVGETRGFIDGRESGYTQGLTEGYDSGIEEGYLDGLIDGAGRGYTVRDPSEREMWTFLNVDSTDKREYVPDEFTCLHFAATLKQNAFDAGYHCYYIRIRFPDGTGHAIIGFNTTNSGLLYIEPQSDELMECEIGRPFWDRSRYASPDFDDTVISIVIMP